MNFDTFGSSMRLARKNAGLSLRKLSEISGINYRLISRYERDEIRPRIDTAEILADALNISIDEYIGHDVKKQIDRVGVFNLEYIKDAHLSEKGGGENA